MNITYDLTKLKNDPLEIRAINKNFSPEANELWYIMYVCIYVVCYFHKERVLNTSDRA